jgi:hypothetical protein
MSIALEIQFFSGESQILRNSSNDIFNQVIILVEHYFILELFKLYYNRGIYINRYIDI